MLTAYETTGKILGQQLAVLERVETDLQKQLDAVQTEAEKDFLTQQLEQNQQLQKELTQTLAETEDKKNQLADMTADQVVAQIDAEVQNIRDLQKKVQLLETLVQQAADAGIGADEILQELNHVNTILDDGIQQAYSLLQTADKAFDLADEILQTANVTVDELEQGMQDITTVYEERWSDMLDGMFGQSAQHIE